MATTGSVSKVNEFMEKCLTDACKAHIDEIPRLKTNPELAKIFTLGYWMGAADDKEFIRLMMEDSTKNGVVQQETKGD